MTIEQTVDGDELFQSFDDEKLQRYFEDTLNIQSNEALVKKRRKSTVVQGGGTLLKRQTTGRSLNNRKLESISERDEDENINEGTISCYTGKSSSLVQ